MVGRGEETLSLTKKGRGGNQTFKGSEHDGSRSDLKNILLSSDFTTNIVELECSRVWIDVDRDCVRLRI